jgi:cell division protein FtsB
MKAPRPGKGAKRVVLLALGALFVFYLIASFLLGERGVVKDVKLRREKAGLEQEVKDLNKSNAELTRQVDMLKHDPEYIERLAREQGLVKDGELVYQYEKEK